MNAARIKKELQVKYPGCVIKERRDAKNSEVTEIICEIDRQQVGEKLDTAVVVIDRTPEHFHKKTKEIYKVIKGTLKVWLNGIESTVKEGETIEILSGTRHRAEGNETWIYCLSEPDWTAEDYFEV